MPLPACVPTYLPAGAWAELEVDTRSPERNATGLTTKLQLAHLKSYAGMGTAQVACVSGCTCEPQAFSALHTTRVTIFRLFVFQVGLMCVGLGARGCIAALQLLRLQVSAAGSCACRVQRATQEIVLIGCWSWSGNGLMPPAGHAAQAVPSAGHHCRRRRQGGAAGAAQGANVWCSPACLPAYTLACACLS